MFRLENIRYVEEAVFGRARRLHLLGVDVTRRRHEQQEVPFFHEDKRRVSDLSAGQQEVVLRTDGILG